MPTQSHVLAFRLAYTPMQSFLPRLSPVCSRSAFPCAYIPIDYETCISLTNTVPQALHTEPTKPYRCHPDSDANLSLWLTTIHHRMRLLPRDQVVKLPLPELQVQAHHQVTNGMTYGRSTTKAPSTPPGHTPSCSSSSDATYGML